MLKKLKLISLCTVVALLFCTLSVSALNVNIDEYLLNAGFPQTIVDEMSIPQKEFIYENSNDKNIIFCGYEKKEFIVNDDGELVENTTNGDVSVCGGSLTSADMTLSVFGTKSYYSSGEVTYSVYPCFKWHKYKKVKNDSFAMNMYSGWEAIPGERNLRLHLMNSQGESAQYVDLTPSYASSTGYSYRVPSHTGAMQGLYEGYAYYDLEKISSSASPRISLYYAHDASTLFNASYSLSVGVAGISLSGNTDKIYTMADNFEVSGLD